MSCLGLFSFVPTFLSSKFLTTALFLCLFLPLASPHALTRETLSARTLAWLVRQAFVSKGCLTSQLPFGATRRPSLKTLNILPPWHCFLLNNIVPTDPTCLYSKCLARLLIATHRQWCATTVDKTSLWRWYFMADVLSWRLSLIEQYKIFC